jgi:hypothetical protein
VSVGGGGFGAVPESGGTAVQVQVTLSNAQHMVHGRAGRSRALGGSSCRDGGDAGGLELHGGRFVTVDVVWPGTQQLVCVAAPVADAFSYQTSFQYKTVPGFGRQLFAGESLPSIPGPDALYAAHPLRPL